MLMTSSQIGRALSRHLSAMVEPLPASFARKGDVLSIAPMLDWTDHHYRFMMRLITRRTKLYTEMVVDATVNHAPAIEKFLYFEPSQHPIALQLGGSNPETLAKAAIVASRYGYDEINLNCGCPSSRVAGAGCFGAKLMLDPELVRDCCAAIQAASSVPVTVKCRLGVDEVDSYEAFRHFVTTVASAGVSHFVVHARKCWLNGLNPHENRTVPPLRHEWVYKLAYELPELTISLNGGVESIDTAVQMLSMTREDGGKYVDALPAMPTFSEAKREAKAAVVASKAKKERPRAESTENDAALSCEGCGEVPASTKHDTSSESVLHGPPRLTADPSTVGTGLLGSVMIGRFAYNQPWAFCDVDRVLFGVPNPGFTRREIVLKYLEYADGVLIAHEAALKGEAINESSWPATCPLTPLQAHYVRGSAFLLSKPIMKLFTGMGKGGVVRRHITEALTAGRPFRTALEEALEMLIPEELDQRPPG